MYMVVLVLVLNQLLLTVQPMPLLKQILEQLLEKSVTVRGIFKIQEQYSTIFLQIRGFTRRL